MGTLAELWREMEASDNAAAILAARPRKLEASFKTNRIGKPLSGDEAIQQGAHPTGKRGPGCHTYVRGWAGILAQLESGHYCEASLDWCGAGRYTVGTLTTHNLYHAMAWAKFTNRQCIDTLA